MPARKMEFEEVQKDITFKLIRRKTLEMWINNYFLQIKEIGLNEDNLLFRSNR